MRHPLLAAAAVGQALIPVIRHISQDKINRFGIATGSTGAVHVDPAYCRDRPLKTTLAHGFLTMAYVCEMMEINFGMDWAHSGELEVKFIGAARPGDSVVVSGVICGVTPIQQGIGIDCEVSVSSQSGMTVLVGATCLVQSVNP